MSLTSIKDLGSSILSGLDRFAQWIESPESLKSIKKIGATIDQFFSKLSNSYLSKKPAPLEGRVTHSIKDPQAERAAAVAASILSGSSEVNKVKEKQNATEAPLGGPSDQPRTEKKSSKKKVTFAPDFQLRLKRNEKKLWVEQNVLNFFKTTKEEKTFPIQPPTKNIEIETIDENIFTLPKCLTIDLTKLTLSETLKQQIYTTSKASGYEGPKFLLSKTQPQETRKPEQAPAPVERQEENTSYYENTSPTWYSSSSSDNYDYTGSSSLDQSEEPQRLWWSSNNNDSSSKPTYKPGKYSGDPDLTNW